jgi:alkylation response protein AidB-like acyl-CoA dehydrogenase
MSATTSSPARFDRVTSPADEEFRTELRAWLAAHPPNPVESTLSGVERELTPTDVAQQRARQRLLAEHGWAGVAWPREFGGRSATPKQQLIFHEECQRVGGGPPPLFFVGLSHAGPTLITHGTPEQQKRWLPGILSGEILFAQCFSEPGAGSDLAAISTRGVVDGEHLVITGEKRWSSQAQHADYCELLVRTDPNDRYSGLTFLVADLRTPGITVRPIRTVTGASEFNEVFFDEARIPLDHIIGEIGDGWKVATTTLTFERSTAFAPTIIGLQYVVAELAERARGDAVLTAEVDSLARSVLAARALLYKCVSEQEGHAPSPGSGVLKLIASELNHKIAEFAALHWPDRTVRYLSSFGLRIGGGTSEIQRNIISERMLGLPKESKGQVTK